MRKVRVDYSGLTAGKLFQRSTGVHDGLNGNAAFPNLPVSVATLNTQNAALQTAINNSRTRDTHALAVLRDAKATVVDSLRQDADYVNAIAAGHEATLISSGFELTRDASSGVPDQVRNIEAKFTGVRGSIDLFWKRTRLAHYYNVFMSADNGATWVLFNTVIGRRIMVEQLESGRRYQFKVVPVGTQGQGPESEIASQLAA
jgi:hypothetical protein